MSPRPFRIALPQAEVLDLQRRLRTTRLPAQVSGYGWNEGTDGAYLRDFVAHWLHRYEWREREAQLNELDHFLADIDGETIHFIHAKGRGANPVPLLLLHGWPSSFVQMIDILPLLTEPRTDGSVTFDVVAASLPGYPFTRPATEPGMNFARIGELMVRLMTEILGYQRFAGRGSDQGGLVLQQIGLSAPQHLIGLHRSGITPFANPLPPDLSPEEIAYQEEVRRWAVRETDYARLQAARPETLVPALTDSPVALASWFLEKFQRWGDCPDGLDAAFGRDRLIDNIALHWFTGSAAAATRLYHEAALAPGRSGRVEVPTAIMMPLRDGVTVPAPRRWCERSYNLMRWSILPRGGHFPEWECPAPVADDIRAFFTSLCADDATARPSLPQPAG